MLHARAYKPRERIGGKYEGCTTKGLNEQLHWLSYFVLDTELTSGLSKKKNRENSLKIRPVRSYGRGSEQARETDR